MNSWWDELLEKINLERIGCAIVIGVLCYGIYWFVFESSFTTKIMVGVLVAAFGYIVYTSGGDSDEEDEF